MQKILTTVLVVAGLGVSFSTAQAQTAATEAPAQYNCARGDKFTVTKTGSDEKFVNLKWQNKTHLMERTATTTGAHRFENKKSGLVLINIPAKSMLFDSKKGKPLANECQSNEQRRSMAMAQPS